MARDARPSRRRSHHHEITLSSHRPRLPRASQAPDVRRTTTVPRGRRTRHRARRCAGRCGRRGRRGATAGGQHLDAVCRDARHFRAVGQHVPPLQRGRRNGQRAGPVGHDRERLLTPPDHPRAIRRVAGDGLVRIRGGALQRRQAQRRQRLERQPGGLQGHRDVQRLAHA